VWPKRGSGSLPRHFRVLKHAASSTAPVREDQVSRILLERSRFYSVIEELRQQTSVHSFERPDDVEPDSLNTLWQVSRLRSLYIAGLVKHLAEEHQGCV
jgi:hypothetical protein